MPSSGLGNREKRKTEALPSLDQEVQSEAVASLRQTKKPKVDEIAASTLTASSTTAITEDEAKLYDRQIRLWGFAAQERMRNSSILIVGCRALSQEIMKNLILAGVGSVTLVDPENVSEADQGAQFLLSPESVGKNRAASVFPRAQALNPRVRVCIDTEDISSKPKEFFKGFDVVIMTDCDFSVLKHINQVVRSFGKKFFAADTYGLFGYIFIDLGQHEYIKEVKLKSRAKVHGDEVTSRTRVTISYTSLSEAIEGAKFDKMTRKGAKKIKNLVMIMTLWRFQATHGRLPSLANEEADNVLLKLAAEEVERELGVSAKGMSGGALLEDSIVQLLLRNARVEIAPVAAIMGGVCAQEVLGALGGRSQPIKNIFAFEGIGCTGEATDLCPPAPTVASINSIDLD